MLHSVNIMILSFCLQQWDRSSRRVWLGLQYSSGTGLTWVDGQRIVAYPASSRLFVWESRRLLSQEVGRYFANILSITFVI